MLNLLLIEDITARRFECHPSDPQSIGRSRHPGLESI